MSATHSLLALLTLAGAVSLAAAPLDAQSTDADAEELRRLHAELLEAHRTKDVDRWMAVEAPRFVAVNGGDVAYPTVDSRRANRAGYLASAHFEVYRDLREPEVRISADGSLGWLIAQVEVKGYVESDTRSPTPFHDIWAWVELYEKRDEGWLLVGNVSNRKPGSDTGPGAP